MDEMVEGREVRAVGALGYEPVRAGPARRGAGGVMGVGFVLVLMGFVPGGAMIAATDVVRMEFRFLVVGVFAAVLMAVVGSGLFLIVSTGREMLRR